jgi:hypothetical protein
MSFNFHVLTFSRLQREGRRDRRRKEGRKEGRKERVRRLVTN